MQTQYYLKNVELNAGTKEKMEKKLDHLSKYQKSLNFKMAQIDISRDTHHRKGDVFRVEINVEIPKKSLRAVETGPDMLMAFDLAAEKVDRQAREEKDRQGKREK